MIDIRTTLGKGRKCLFKCHMQRGLLIWGSCYKFVKSITKLDMDTIEDYMAKDDDRYEALFRQIENLKPSNPIKLNFPEPMAELIFPMSSLIKIPN